ncbi:hypothetical protein CLV81_2810 [Flagellimonas meridianipacifica]|uniref:Uncharacterized protein n=1 Tax=Flagellimonas meridianipacifica TaxID=1080225 RepID=A0A2T0MAA6_9FLAO|nr:hypothetical protein CLV81_2810 [Allomuricauda pacifica]
MMCFTLDCTEHYRKVLANVYLGLVRRAKLYFDKCGEDIRVPPGTRLSDYTLGFLQVSRKAPD